MNELIKVDFTSERPAVSARELHDFLGVETPYHKWFPRMCEYGFTENEDYSVTDIFVHNPSGGPQSMKDAAVSIDMAKATCDLWAKMWRRRWDIMTQNPLLRTMLTLRISRSPKGGKSPP